MAQDFLSALKEAWEADATLTAAGLGSFHFGVDPGGDYPYVVAIDLGSKVTLRNYGKGQIHEQHLRINVFADDEGEAATLGSLARTFLESIQANPLTFTEGRQVDFHQTGENLIKLRKPGAGARPFVWLRSITLVLKYSRDRA